MGAWRGAIAAWLQAHKTYPDAARRDGSQGRVVVRFSLDRAGRATELVVVQGSGSAALDEAALSMLRHAQLPPPPPPAAETTTITLPIRYSLAP